MPFKTATPWSSNCLRAVSYTHLDVYKRQNLNPFQMLLRHRSGDWGDVQPEDALANEAAAIHGNRVISSYAVAGERLWIITEADRSATTLLLPEEY